MATGDKIKLGVLWKQVSREGNRPYLSGRADHDTLEAAVDLLRRGGRLLVLSNKKRPDKRDPDCLIYVVPEQSAQRMEGANSSRGRGGPPRPLLD